MGMTVEELLNQPKPWKYDFKFEMKKYYEKYNENGRYEKFIPVIKRNINKNRNAINRWFAYKTLEERWKEPKLTRKYFFDCDNSNDTCGLMKMIYGYLWGWNKIGRNNFGDSQVYKEVCELGGDTINSFATTMIEYINLKGDHKKKITSVKECNQQIDLLGENKGFLDFARNTNCIGNFVLVPRGFNGYRGFRHFIKDYWDLSLACLLNKRENEWLSGEGYIKRAPEDKKFVRYINTFFLWDYVDKNYEVKPLFASHEKKLKSVERSSNGVCPKGDDEFKEFLVNVNRYIERRGIFMTAMLQLAVSKEVKEIKLPKKWKNEVKESEEWKDWGEWDVSEIYKYIVKTVFLTNTCYKDFESVTEIIKGLEIGQNDTVKKILNHLE